MTIDLNATLSWTAAGPGSDRRVMLESLQPNILKAHVRTHLRVLLLTFADAAEGRQFFLNLLHASPPIHKSAHRHLVEVDDHRTGSGSGPDPGSPYVGVGLSHSGTVRLGVAERPWDPAFVEGMKGRSARLRDPAVPTWDSAYRADIHAIVLIGAEDQSAVTSVADRIGELCPGGSVKGEEEGQTWCAREGHPAEHFGFRDGISEPLFLDEDVVRAAAALPGEPTWSPAQPLKRVLVPDATNDPKHYGSYLVYRKLEQNVQAFVEAERDLAQFLGLSGPERGVARAMLVGRFRDGTPILDGTPGTREALQDDFTYVDDPAGRWCPLTAHIRKTNPRRSSVEPQDERRLMARRGQTYGDRNPEPADDAPLEDFPSGGVGLLFMTLNSDIREQFEFVQQSWVNDEDRPIAGGRRPAGADQIIGQGPRTELKLPSRLGGPDFVPIDPIDPILRLSEAVTMKGGEYFFLPSWPTLEAWSTGAGGPS